MTAIYRRELESYFTGVIGYVMIAFILAIFGIYTTIICFNQGYANFELVPYTVKYTFLITTPILSMRVLSEERRQQTDKLLFSNAVEPGKIVVSKYLAMITVLLIPMLIVCAYPLILSEFGRVSLPTSYSAIFGCFLMGAALLAIGMFTSSLTDSQIVAAALSFGMVLLAYLASDFNSIISGSAVTALYGFTFLVAATAIITRFLTKSWYMGGIVAAVLEVALLAVYFLAPDMVTAGLLGFIDAISVFDKMDTFKNGVFDLSAVFYYISVISVFLFFSTQALEKRRWG